MLGTRGSCSHVVLCGVVCLVCDGGRGIPFDLSFSITLFGWYAIYNNSMQVLRSLITIY